MKAAKEKTNRIAAWWRTYGPTRRRLIQIYAALLYNAHLKGFIKGEIYTGPMKNLCVPGLNCYSCPGAVGACPLGALQNGLAASGTRAPWYILGILMLFGLTLGRTICGWICPFGLIQELIYKLPVPKLRKNRLTRLLSYCKYALLLFLVLYIPVVFRIWELPVPAFCKYICPAGTLEGAAALLANPANKSMFSMLGTLFVNKCMVLAVVLLACVFIYRAFCRFLCPLGAIYGLFSTLSLSGVRVEASKCTACGRCIRQCKMDIRQVGDHECIHCGECVSVCAEQAIQWKDGVICHFSSAAGSNDSKKKTDRGRRTAARICGLFILGAVIWYANYPEKEKPQVTAETEETVETQTSIKTEEVIDLQNENIVHPDFVEGMQCPMFQIPLYDDEKSVFSLEDHMGKPVVINFWATWCGPCVAELPYFQKLWDTYGDRISLVAIHSELVTEDVQTFIDKAGYTIWFGQDTDGSVIKALGGSNMLPMTVVLDKEGKTIYNKVGSVTEKLLTELVEPLL